MVIMQLAESVMRLGGAEARRLERKVIRPTTPVREDPGYVGTSHPLRTNGQNKYSFLFAIVTNIVYLCH